MMMTVTVMRDSACYIYGMQTSSQKYTWPGIRLTAY